MSAVRDNWERLLLATLRREQLRHLSRLDSISTTDSADSFRCSSPLSEKSLDLQKLGYIFRYREIVQATNSFSDENLIHRGSSGDFFRADLVVPSPIFSRSNRNLELGLNNLVVKRIDLKLVSNQESYLRELDVLSKVRNSRSRFLAFVGQCLERKDVKFFVYRYASNGDLSNSLFKKKGIDDGKLKGKLRSLDWITRMKIARGTAAGLAYLHQECSPPLVHGDVQASSILLDNNFEVRLGSLGHSGAHDHTSDDDWIIRESEMHFSGMARANDVYCFGKVLAELVTGKLGISGTNSAVTNEWLESEFLRYVTKNDMEVVCQIVDPTLFIGEDLLEEVWSMSVVSKYCLNPQPQQRPLMRDVVKALEYPLEFIRAAQSGSELSHQESWPAAALLQIIDS